MTLLAAVGDLMTAPAPIDPVGPSAEAIDDLWWWMLGAGTAVFLLVVVLLSLALRKGSRRERRDKPPVHARWTRSFVLVLGVGLPVAVIVPLAVGSLLIGRDQHAETGSAPLVVEVVGHQFWWEVRYPDMGVVTANEVHVPVGTPVEFRLTSEDVIHSFWVPQAAGKMDMIPGKVNSHTFEVSRPGVYRGECAEFCGLQHARMHFLLVAEDADEFENWAGSQRAAAAESLSAEALEGRDIFRTSSCADCHRVAGVSDGDAGPDLTHLASRRTIAAGLLENNRGHLAGWLLDPQALKPGARMPATNLTGPELESLLTYLEELE